MKKTVQEIMEQFMSEALSSAVDLRRWIHSQPEVSGEEHLTQKIVCDALPTSFKVRNVAGTGVIADLVFDSSYPFLGFRADMDGLRMNEETGLPFASQNAGVSHACGHDFHTAALVTLAPMLHNLIGCGAWTDQRYNIRLIFEPSEEVPPGGAIHVISEGGLNGVKALIGFHLWSQAPTGIIQIPEPNLMTNCAYSRRLRVEIVGKGGHAARPNLTNDPYFMARRVLDALDNLRIKLKTEYLDPILRCRIDDKQTAVNVIPEKVWVEGTVRTKHPETLKELERGIPEAIERIVQAYNGHCIVDFPIGYEPIKNNPDVVDQIRSIITLGGLPTAPTDPLMGGESFGHYASRVPSAFLMIGCGGTADEVENQNGPHVVMHHSGKFNPDERCLENMLKCQLALALDWQF